MGDGGPHQRGGYARVSRPRAGSQEARRRNGVGRGCAGRRVACSAPAFVIQARVAYTTVSSRRSVVCLLLPVRPAARSQRSLTSCTSLLSAGTVCQRSDARAPSSLSAAAPRCARRHRSQPPTCRTRRSPSWSPRRARPRRFGPRWLALAPSASPSCRSLLRRRLRCVAACLWPEKAPGRAVGSVQRVARSVRRAAVHLQPSPSRRPRARCVDASVFAALCSLCEAASALPVRRARGQRSPLSHLRRPLGLRRCAPVACARADADAARRAPQDIHASKFTNPNQHH